VGGRKLRGSCTFFNPTVLVLVTLVHTCALELLSESLASSGCELESDFSAELFVSFLPFSYSTKLKIVAFGSIYILSQQITLKNVYLLKNKETKEKSLLKSILQNPTIPYFSLFYCPTFASQRPKIILFLFVFFPQLRTALLKLKDLDP
jgi:hypothetical protein